MKKRFLGITGLCLAAAMIMSACKKADDSVATMSELVPNVITQTTAAGDTATAPPVATDVNGSTYVTHETKPPEELQSIIQEMLTAPATTPTAVMEYSGNSENGEIRSYEDKYAYNTLTDDEKKLYANIVQNAMELGLKVDPEYRGVDKETWDRVYGMVYNQEPQLFWVSPKLSAVGRIYYRNYSADSIKAMQEEIDATVNKLLADMKGMSDFDKMAYINDYLSLNATFLYGVEETDTESAYNSTIYNAFVNGTEKQGDIQCVGYAHAVQYLCDRIGINSMVITGNSKEGDSHAWNIVSIDGEWYNFDVTWDDPILETPNYKNVRHMYVLVPDAWILDITHFSQNIKYYANGGSFKFFDPPSCTATAMNWFIQKGKVYNSAETAVAELTSQLENAAANGLRTTEIMCSDKAVYDAVRAQMKTMQDNLKAKYPTVKGLSDKCAEAMLVVELDVVYN